jgi:Uroporphyrinogen decarboxylase (URO-D)
MNDRQRFLNCMLFKEVDRMPRWEWAFLDEIGENWIEQGLPEDVIEKGKWVDFFKLDKGCGYANNSSMAEKVEVNVDLSPDFSGKIIEEDENTITQVSKWGGVEKILKTGASLPQYIDFGVKTAADFQKCKSRWNPNDPKRYPKDWEDRKIKWKNRDYPISIWAYGWYGILRELMGVENLSIAFYDNESLIFEISEFWSDFLIQAYEKALSEVDVDYVLFWEDLAFKNGPLLSPALFKKFFLPQYKKVITNFKKYGMKVFMVDSDGNIDDILPLWIEGGVNVLAPFEVGAGMDVVKVRQRFGKDLAIVGGIDKMEIAKGADAIGREIDLRVKPLIDSGGYIPTLDHAVPVEMSLENYLYYRDCLVSLEHKTRKLKE